MQPSTAALLLANPELVKPVAPWCTFLDNLELGTLLLTQPWLATHGLRRAELERQLSHLGRDLPIGPVYFQRVKRAVARLAEIGTLRGEGSGRAPRFTVTPAGFAALILNLRVLRTDPTIDGSEFELKRALVAMWNLALERVSELPEEIDFDPELERFFAEVEAIEVLGRKVVTDDLVGRALDIQGLIEAQRQRVLQLLDRSERRLAQLAEQAELLRDLDLARLAESILPAASAAVMKDPATATVVRTLAAGSLPSLDLRAGAHRYRRYLDYLDDLAAMYLDELKVVNLQVMRRLAGRVEK